jgi:PAS domain S-box-containing protein
MQTINVLIVEDNPADAKLTQMALEQASAECDYEIRFDFYGAKSLLETFEIADLHNLDVILLDLGLLDSSGIDTVKKTIKRIQNVPIIAHTGLDDIHVGIEAMRLGAASYMVKGESTPSLFMKNILFALEQYRLKKELEASAKALEFERQKLQFLVDALPNIIGIKDENFRNIFVNNAMCDFLNKTKEELLGKTVFELLPQDVAQQIWTNEKMATETNTMQVVEEKVVNVSGEARIFLGFKKPLEIDNGKMGLLIALTDITEKHEARWISALLRKFFDNTNEGMIITDKDGLIATINPAFTRITGYSQKEVLGQNPRILKSGEHEQEFYEKMWHDVLENGRWEGEIHNKRKDGEVYPEWLTITPLRDENGEIEHFVAVFFDLTQLKITQQRMDEQDKIILVQSRFSAMGEMISMIAHQWRQPITTIGMGVNNMLMDIELSDIDTEAFKSHLLLINDQVQFLSHTIDDFRDFFKPGKKAEDMHINKAIESVLKIIGKSLENNNVKVELQTQYDPVITAYESELIQVLLAIINNAKDALVEHAVKPAIITITTRENRDFDGFVELRICDNGGGVPEDIMQKIFEPYFTTKSAKSGTGLGLYIAKSIIEKHQKGTISVENIDNGACFTIHIPLI